VSRTAWWCSGPDAGHGNEATICDVLAPEGRHRRRAWKALKGAGVDYLLKGSTSAGSAASRRCPQGFVPVPALGPILTWRPVATPMVPTMDQLALGLGDIELFSDLQQHLLPPIGDRFDGMMLKSGVSIRPVPARIGGQGSSGCNKAVEVVARDTDTDTHRRERIPHAANVGGNGRNADERCLGPSDTARPNQPASGQTRASGSHPHFGTFPTTNPGGPAPAIPTGIRSPT
jgi:hypothetical protein